LYQANALRKSATRSESGFLQRPHQLWLDPFWSELSRRSGFSQVQVSFVMRRVPVWRDQRTAHVAGD
jgi:hypothetical protein